jgi:hypothetical protein
LVARKPDSADKQRELRPIASDRSTFSQSIVAVSKVAAATRWKAIDKGFTTRGIPLLRRKPRLSAWRPDLVVMNKTSAPSCDSFVVRYSEKHYLD